MKSAAVSTGALTANTIYRLSRQQEAFVAPDYDTDDNADARYLDAHGMIFQNRTNGDMYLWYGTLPAAYQNLTAFKAAAYKVSAGASFVPPMSQVWICYALFSSPAAGYIHHLSH